LNGWRGKLNTSLSQTFRGCNGDLPLGKSMIKPLLNTGKYINNSEEHETKKN
jgi:hypothetical protein